MEWGVLSFALAIGTAVGLLLLWSGFLRQHRRLAGLEVKILAQMRGYFESELQGTTARIELRLKALSRICEQGSRVLLSLRENGRQPIDGMDFKKTEIASACSTEVEELSALMRSTKFELSSLPSLKEIEQTRMDLKKGSSLDLKSLLSDQLS